MPRPGDVVECAIASLDDAGAGVATIEGAPLHVDGALPGERVRARIRATGRAGAFASCEAVLAASPDRARPRCPVFGRCGGCQVQHLRMDAQLRAKQWRVTRALARAGLAGITVLPPIAAPDPWGQRTEARLVATRGPDGALALGLYARRSHEVVAIEACPAQHPLADAVLAAVRALAPAHGLTAWDAANGAGLLRSVLVRVAPSTGRARCVLVTTGADWPGDAAFARALRACCPPLASVARNVNDTPGHRVLGPATRLLDGADDLPAAPAVAPEIDREVTRAAGLANAPGATVVDAYAGTGALAFACAARGATVHAIERDAATVAAGAAAAERAGLAARVRWRAADAADGLRALAAENVRPHALLLAPPRAGCAPPVVEAVAALRPAVLVLVSGRPAALARDAARLAALGWRGDRVQPVDLIPHTTHIACVARLRRRRG